MVLARAGDFNVPSCYGCIRPVCSSVRLFFYLPKTPKWTWSEEGDDEEEEEEEAEEEKEEGGGTKKAGGRIEGQRWGRAGEAAAARG